jgi:hypothetical protein
VLEAIQELGDVVAHRPNEIEIADLSRNEASCFLAWTSLKLQTYRLGLEDEPLPERRNQTFLVFDGCEHMIEAAVGVTTEGRPRVAISQALLPVDE